MFEISFERTSTTGIWIVAVLRRLRSHRRYLTLLNNINKNKKDRKGGVFQLKWRNQMITLKIVCEKVETTYFHFLSFILYSFIKS